MKESREEKIVRLNIGAIFSGCLFICVGILVVTTGSFSKWAPGIGDWLVMGKNQSTLAGLWMICIGVYAGWYCYLKRAVTLFPDVHVGLRVVAIFLIAILGIPAWLTTVPVLQPYWKLWCIVFIGLAMCVCVVVHVILTQRIKEESNQEFQRGQ